MKVIDNFLPISQFQNIQSIIQSNYFTWCYFSGRGLDEPKDFFFHTFYRDGENNQSSYLSILGPILQKMGGKLIRAKSVLTTKTAVHCNSGYHHDYDDITTSIYYINTNNGWTEFEDGSKVESVANRMVTFDSNLIHGGVSCTDQSTRVLVNFNYER